MKRIIITILIVTAAFPRISRSESSAILKTTSTAILKTETGRKSTKILSNFAQKNLPVDPGMALGAFQFFVMGDLFYKTHGAEFKIEPMRSRATLSLSADF